VQHWGVNPQNVDQFTPITPGGTFKLVCSQLHAKPPEMPQQYYNGLTPKERRYIPDGMKRDKIIEREGYTKLCLPYEQIKFKICDHGGLHDVPYSINSKGDLKN
jgi:hypothetical protein